MLKETSMERENRKLRQRVAELERGVVETPDGETAAAAARSPGNPGTENVPDNLELIRHMEKEVASLRQKAQATPILKQYYEACCDNILPVLAAERAKRDAATPKVQQAKPLDRKIGKVNGPIAKSTALVAELQERIAEMQAAAREEQNSIDGWQQE